MEINVYVKGYINKSKMHLLKGIQETKVALLDGLMINVLCARNKCTPKKPVRNL